MHLNVFIYMYSMSATAHTKFEILPQMEYTKTIAIFEPMPAVSFVEPGGTMKVQYTIFKIDFNFFLLMYLSVQVWIHLFMQIYNYVCIDIYVYLRLSLYVHRELCI